MLNIVNPPLRILTDPLTLMTAAVLFALGAALLWWLLGGKK